MEPKRGGVAVGGLRALAFPRSERKRQILTLSLPIIGGMISQNVFNLVDTGMVGVLGDEALAAVGMGSFVNFMASAFVTGMAAGVQAIAARRYGEGRKDEMAVPLNGGLLLALGVALPFTFVFIWLAPHAYSLLGHPAGVQELSVPYLQLRLLGMIGLGMNFAFRGYWNAVHLPRLYMRTLIGMHCANILLNWILIFGHLGFPALGVRGAAIGTTLATYLGTAIYFVLAFRYATRCGFLRHLPDVETVRGMLRLSLPAGLQNFAFASGMTLLFWILGSLGTAELAAGNVLTQLTLLGILPLIGFGIAAATLVGNALGRGDTPDAARWGWEVSAFAMVIMGTLALPIALYPQAPLALFLHDPSTLELARIPLRLVAATLWIDALGTVLLNAHIGAGSTRRVMQISVSLQWGGFLPVAYLLGPVLGHGLVAIWLANVSYRAIQAGVFARSWSRGSWAAVRL